jgi:hypothetical protein
MSKQELSGLYKELDLLQEERNLMSTFNAIESLMRDLAVMHDRYCATRLDDEVAGYIKVKHLRKAKALHVKLTTKSGDEQ